ncbi:MAG TPA: flagellar biosynthetic protein FliO [Thiopseudomonas sp.]|nr:flagellar biosynthetic protein FliO [Thiopseudomonas sp.]HZJ93636.1 flagellar biosynthetic protein FliO [Thiopseudomonas sp.]
MRAFILLMLASSSAWAADSVVLKKIVEPKTLPASSGVLDVAPVSGQLLQLVLGLMLVIGLIFLLAWLVRRIQQSLPVKSSNQAISLLASQALGPRDRLLLVQVGKEQILLGLTPGTITPLHVLQEPVDISTPEGNMTSAFAQRLAKVLKTSAKDKS